MYESDLTRFMRRFLEEHPVLPILEGDVVHFVHVGEAQDVAIAASMLDSSRPTPMARVDGTGFFHASFPIAPRSRIEYAFQVDLGQLAPDPRNPDRIEVDGSPMSEVLNRMLS